MLTHEPYYVATLKQNERSEVEKPLNFVVFALKIKDFRLLFAFFSRMFRMRFVAPFDRVVNFLNH